MATQAEHAAELNSLKTQVDKIYTEVTSVNQAAQARIAELEALLAAGGSTTAEVDAAVTAIRAALQPLDDLTPDA